MIIKYDDKEAFEAYAFNFSKLEEKKILAVDESFKLPDFSHSEDALKKNYKQIIRREREYSEKNEFVVSPIIEEQRGHREQAKADYEKLVGDEVNKRLTEQLASIKEVAIKEGRELGKKQIEDELKSAVNAQVEELKLIINEVKEFRPKVFEAEISEIRNVVKTIAKWVVMKEVSEGADYLMDLLKKVLQDFKNKNKILIRLNQEWFQKHNEIYENLKAQFSSLEGIRIEMDPDLKKFGMMVESENKIIDATIETQLKSIDDLFNLDKEKKNA